MGDGSLEKICQYNFEIFYPKEKTAGTEKDAVGSR